MTDQQPLSNEVALRIGMAARLLPSTPIGTLIDALEDKLGAALTEDSLKGITVTSLKTALEGTDDNPGGGESPENEDLTAYKEAVRILWGASEEAELPVPKPYAAGDMPRSVRVAVASNEGEELDGHFGSCLRFLVYQVSSDEVRLVDVRPTHPADGTGDKNGARVALIHDCRMIYAVSIGGPAMAKVFKADIHISKHKEGGPARARLTSLQEVLAHNPPPWLAKAIAGSTASAGA